MNILVIRRDNIGDLVCTTPMLAALRKAMPDAWIGVLVNQYNVAVMRGNPDVDAVFAYRKAKHRGPGESKLAIWLETAGLLWKLRRKGIEVVVAPVPGAAQGGSAGSTGVRRRCRAVPAVDSADAPRCEGSPRSLRGARRRLP